jgi:hypothetical protein
MYNNRVYETTNFCDHNSKTFEKVLAMDPVPMATIFFHDSSRHFPKKYFMIIKFEDLEDCILRLSGSRILWYVNQTPYDTFTAPIKKIQRVMKKQARTRLQAKHLALAMCMHARLGQSSLIQCLGLDLVRTCLQVHVLS